MTTNLDKYVQQLLADQNWHTKLVETNFNDFWLIIDEICRKILNLAKNYSQKALPELISRNESKDIGLIEEMDRLLKFEVPGDRLYPECRCFSQLGFKENVDFFAALYIHTLKSWVYPESVTENRQRTKVITGYIWKAILPQLTEEERLWLARFSLIWSKWNASRVTYHLIPDGFFPY